MLYQLCSHDTTHEHGKTSKGSQRYFCPVCQQTFTEPERGSVLEE